MVTREQLFAEIARLENIRNGRNHTDVERINLTRLQVCRRYIALSDEKNAAIDQGRILSWDYDRTLLVLLRDILIHTRDNWALETDQQRKGSLHNIVRTVLLLRKEFTCLYNIDYTDRAEGTTEINLWRNFGFLVQCQITPPDPGVNQRFAITFIEVNTILREAFELIDTVLNIEISVGFILQSIRDWVHSNRLNMPELILDQYNQHEQNIRVPYRDPHALPYLHAFTTYKREQFRIEKMLQVTRFALTLNIADPTHQMALLRQLQIIGESITGKNLSEQTKRLVDDIDWQLFVRLRNKLSHNEWGIHRNLLMRNLTPLQDRTTAEFTQFIRISLEARTIDGQLARRMLRLHNIRHDLVNLQVSLQNLQTRHNTMGITTESKIRHYSPDWHLRAKTRSEFIQFIRASMEAQVIDGEQAKQFLRGLKEDIRGRDIPMDEIRPVMVQVFDNHHPNYQRTRHLATLFQALKNTFRNELVYHRNLENPDADAQERIARRLAPHQVRIRALHDLLEYSEDTYITDRQHHPFSFDPLTIIRLVRVEIESMRNKLLPLQGSNEALALAFPEDTTDFPYPNIINAFFNHVTNIYGNISPRTVGAITNIRNYFNLIQKPLCLKMDGLYGVRRGELGQFDPRILFERMPDFIDPIRTFGTKCLFYSSLVRRAEIVEACFYHMARVQKYIVILRLSNEVPENQLPNFNEFKALRNFIHHGLDLFETMNQSSLEFMSRYSSMFFNDLYPAMNTLENTILQSRLRQQPNANALLLQHDIYRRTARLSNNNINPPVVRRRASL